MTSTEWRKEYERRSITAEKAAEMVQSGNIVAFTFGREPLACGLALASRKSELQNVKVFVFSPSYDLGWYDEGWNDSFQIIINVPTAVCQDALNTHRIDTVIFPPFEKLQPPQNVDFLFTEISTPDENGFCSFGNSLWNKKRHILETKAAGKIVIAEVNSNLIRTYGDNFIHVSDIDYFVEHVSSGSVMGTGSLGGRAIKKDEPYMKDITGYVSSLIHDGDTLQIGIGRTTEPLVSLGLLNGRHDIGFHSEATPPGVITLVKEGVINGKRKTLHPGKVVVTSVGGSSREEMKWVHMNPLFYLVTYEYLEDIRVIAANDNMTCINNTLLIDLWGQSTAETIGFNMLGTPGGQPTFVIGAAQSKGGKSITILPSTSQGRSRIVPVLPQGTVVTIPRTFTDYVVTEYGIATLRGKTTKERVNELISVAHPDFRAELRIAAKNIC